ncbi:hypothetical protein F5Y19DRAFT_424696 [Xylariaceae sp. FL1651]|nr:hypothetical protein F5Y19DRAFT_424696 [Xylariaceae sp. FL1651]
MEAASTAIDKLLGKSSSEAAPASSNNSNGEETTSVHTNTAPAVEHETIHRKHEEREQKVVEKERHQDHYKTTIQPLKDREVVPEEHRYEQAGTQHRNIDHNAGNDAKATIEREQAQFKDTSLEGNTQKTTTKEPTLASEHTHHHLHETIQPVIEKETVVPSVTHKTIPIKETHQDPSVYEGTTTNAPISKEEFQGRLRGNEAP